MEKLVTLYNCSKLCGIENLTKTLRIVLTHGEVDALKNWLKSSLPETNSGANSGANLFSAHKPLIDNRLQKLAERQGDGTREADVRECLDNPRDVVNGFSSASAISAVFAAILEQFWSKMAESSFISETCFFHF